MIIKLCILESGFPVTFSNDKFAHDFSFLQSNAKPGNRYCCLQSPSNKVLQWRFVFSAIEGADWDTNEKNQGGTSGHEPFYNM